jgi:hypothetical protein
MQQKSISIRCIQIYTCIEKRTEKQMRTHANDYRVEYFIDNERLL